MARDPDSGDAAPSRGERGRVTRRRLRRRWLVALVGLGALVVWGIAAAVTGLAAYDDLEAARAETQAARRALTDADLDAGRQHLDDAVSHASASADALNGAHVRPLRVVPWIGSNLRAATVLSETVRDAGTAAADFLRVVTRLGDDVGGRGDGQVSMAYLGELATPARELSMTLSRTAGEVDALSGRWLLQRVKDARSEYLEIAAPVAEQTDMAADLLDASQLLLGEEEPKRYLVVAAALSEIRASGGLLGSWSLLTADDGQLAFGEFIDPDQHPVPEMRVEAPNEDYARRYGPLGALRQWRNSNLTPDFPSAAQVVASIWEEGGGEPIDGVIMLDPVAYERLAARTGGLDVPGYGSFAPDEVKRFVALDAYDAFESDEERKEVLGGVATAAFAEVFAVLEGEDVAASARMLAALVSGGHLRIYSRDAEVQQALDRTGVTGALSREPGESAGVFTNNIAGNKVDWFGSRTLEHSVELGRDGTSRATIEATLRNEAPTEGYGRVVLGPWTDSAEAGDNILLVTFTCSTSCELVESSAGVRRGGWELGRRMADATVDLPAGEERTLRYVTESADAWHFDDRDRLVLVVEHLVQTTLHDSSTTIRVRIPSGTRPVDLPEGARTEDGEVVWQAETSGAVRLELVFEPTRDVAGG